jgi:hypothetical protein
MHSGTAASSDGGGESVEDGEFSSYLEASEHDGSPSPTTREEYISDP